MHLLYVCSLSLSLSARSWCRHHCPLCQSAATVESIVRNPSLDQLLIGVKQAQRAAAAKLTKKLLPKGGCGGAGGAAAAMEVDPNSDAPPPADGNSALLLARATSSQMPLSPMESLFRSHVTAKLLLPWEEAWQELQSRRGEEEGKGRAASAASAGGGQEAAAAAGSAAAAAAPSSAAAASAPGGPSIDIPSSSVASASFYSRASSTLIASYDHFLSTLPPPAYLEPIACSVTLAPTLPPGDGSSATTHQLRFNLHAFDDLTSLVTKIVSQSLKPDQPAVWALRGVSLAPAAVKLMLTGVQPASAAAAIGIPALPIQLNANASDLTISFSALLLAHGHGGGGGGVGGMMAHPLPSCTSVSLTLSGSGLDFVSPAAKPRCFIASFRKEEEQRVDYFSCSQCALNCQLRRARGAHSRKQPLCMHDRSHTHTFRHVFCWCSGICKNCASCCHVGHPLQPFMLAHKPTYAACYCNKKRQCMIK